MSGQYIPELRFPEFDDEWKKEKLTDLLDFKNGFNASKEKYGKGVKFINVLDILNNDFITYEKILERVEIEKDQLKHYEVNYGDILFQRSSETRDEVGKANVYLDEKTAAFGGFVIRGEKKSDYDPMFLNIALDQPSTRSEITSKSGGSTRYNVSQDVLADSSVFLPSKKEQEKIAIFFELLNQKIYFKKEEIKKTEKIKSAYLSEMYPEEGEVYPKRRFEGFAEPWKQLTLNELGEIITGSTPSTQNKSYYAKEGAPWVTPTDINSNITYKTNRYLSEEGKKKARVVPKNTILVTSIASIGKNTLLGTAGSFNQQINGLVPNKKNNPYFLFIQSVFWSNKMKRIAASGTMQIVNKTEFSKIATAVPSLKEQEKIGNFFMNLDKKISIKKEELEKLENLKQSYLNIMFI